MEKELIITLIKEYWDKNPEQRFTQVLFNLGINEFASKDLPEFKDYLLRDPYNDSDGKVLEKIIKNI